MEMQMLVTVKNVDNSKSFFKKSNFSFLNLDGDELIFENLLIEDVDGSNYLIFIISLFLLLLVLLYLFLRNRTTKKPIQKEELKEEIKHLFIRSDRADHKVLFSEILLIEGKKDYVKVSLLNKSYLVRKNLKTFLSELPESKFVRISKSVALNTEQIEKIDKNMLFVKSGNYYIIGKKYNQAIKELLK
jgi:DNA-binding LytR/AlgR family response regulator